MAETTTAIPTTKPGIKKSETVRKYKSRSKNRAIDSK
jgi:hypothetical protein